MSNRTFLGKVGMTPRGEWNNSTTYERLDVVTYEGSSYIALTQSRNSRPSEENQDWMVAAKHGEFTEEQLEEFKEAVITESKQEIEEFTEIQKDELDDYERIKESELDDYTTGKKGDIDTHTTQKIEAYNANANEKQSNFNTNATNKTNTFNENASSKTSAFDDNASSKITAFDNNAVSKTNTFNSNVTEKTTAFNDNATTKTSDFNTNATNKKSDFNSNATSKTNTFNTNASDKLEAYNTNDVEKTEAFNQNAQEKTEAFDEHTVELEIENERLRNDINAGTLTVPGTGENITLENTTDARFKKLGVGGNKKQETTSTEQGDEYDSPSLDHPSEIHAVGENGTANVVVCNKNWFSSEWEQGNINGRTGALENNDSIIRTKDYIDVVPGVHYAIKRSVSNLYMNVRGYDEGKNFVGAGADVIDLIQGSSESNPMNSGRNNCIIASKTGIHYLKFCDGSNDLSTQYMMVVGDTIPTTYTEHQEQEFTIPCQKEMVDQSDYFDWDNELEVHGYGMVNLKDLNWEYRNTNSETGLSTYRVALTGIKQAYNWSVIMKCSHFQYLGRAISGQDAYEKAEGIMRYYATNSTLENIYLNTTISNLADLQTWLNANNVMLVFERETSEQLPFTQEQKTVAKQIKDTAHSYGEQTHIYSTDDVSPIFDVQAIGDINKIIQSLDSRLTLVE